MADNFTLTNIESMSYQRRFNFWGDIFNYNSTDLYTVTSRATGDAGFQLIKPAWDGVNTWSQTGLNYYRFIIDGIALGSGKITSFNWEEGTDIQNKKFSMSFEINSTGNLYNMSGSNYVEIDKSIFSGDFKYVNDFSENFSISIGENGIQETSQEVSFGIDKPVTGKIELKNRIFSGLAQFRIPSIGVRTAFPDIISGNLNSGYITYYNEVYDIYNSRYSFVKKSSYDDNNKATWEYSHSIQLDGEATVTENGSIKSIYFQGTGLHKNLSGARDRWSIIQTGISSRVTETYDAIAGFTGVFGGTPPTLIPTVISKSWQEDPLVGTIDYSYTYTTDPKYAVSGYSFSNERSSSIDQDGFYVLTENGEYRGISENNDLRFGLAYTGYLQGTGNVLSRISGSFLLASALNRILCRPTGNFYLTNEVKTFREFDGIVSYNNVYSNHPSYYSSGNFVKYSNTISDTPPVHLYNKFLVPREDEYIQSASQSTEGVYVNSIKLVGKTGITINDYLNEAYTKVVKPSGSGMLLRFLKSMDYSFNPFENLFEANFEYYYSKYKHPEDTSV